MRPSEIAEADKVFVDTLPIDRIRVTNLKRSLRGNPAYDTDNTIIISMGDRFDADPITFRSIELVLEFD
jgi:hypothetical protein